MRRALKPLILFRSKKYSPLTLAGNEITDASRAVGTQGDGRLNDSSYGIWAAATNLCTNGGFETNTTGWATGGTNTLAVSNVTAKFGTQSCKATYQNSLDLAYFPLAVSAVAYAQSLWIYVPAAYDGTLLVLNATNGPSVSVNMNLRDQWQRVTLTYTALAGASNNLIVHEGGVAPTAGRFVYIDGGQIETGSVATPYVHTDGGTATRAAARVQAPASLLNATQSWVAMRVRFNWASNAVPVSNPALFALTRGVLDAQNRLEGGFISSLGNKLGLSRWAGGVGSDVQPGGALAFASGEIHTVIMTWTATALGTSWDGGAIATAANSSVPTGLVVLDLGSRNTLDPTNQGDVDILWFACGTGTLNDGDAAAIHAFGNSDVGLQAFPGNPTGFWSAYNSFMEVAS